MTDLKQLLDEAAGPEPAVTDTDLTADLTRGQRALKRRRLTGTATAVVATAAAVAVGWSLLPSGATGGAPAPAARRTPTAIKSTANPTTTPTKRMVPPSAQDDPRPYPPVYVGGVPLVANPTPFPGQITCDLIPKGWAIRAKGAEQELYDPKLKNPEKYRALTYTVVVRPSEMVRRPGGLGIDRVADEPWSALGTAHAGKNEAAVFIVTDSDGKRYSPWVNEAYARQGKSTHLIVATSYALPLSWDAFTLLRFAGSCHYKK